MARGPLYQPNYRPQFSGHETFPLRYGWLKKVTDALQVATDSADNRSVFTDSSAIARFGVGKNMVASMRHWAEAVGVIEEATRDSRISITSLGHKLFGPNGVDPFLESHSSLWMLHWHLAGRPDKTTWYWTFSHFPGAHFDREQLVRGLEQLAVESGWNRVATATIKRDVDCFIRTYAPRLASSEGADEDTLESPLTELGLIQQIGKRDGFRLVRNSKPTLSLGMFFFALSEFWTQYSSSRTLSLEAAVYEPGSPGRVFLLNEDDVAERIKQLEDATDGVIRWSETAGLRQAITKDEISVDKALQFFMDELRREPEREAA